jgi:hypothetical protein
MFGHLFGFALNVLKWTFFTLLVLVAGQLVYWRGKTVSDQVKITLSHVENWNQPAAELTSQFRDGAEKISAEERARLKKIFSRQERTSAD